MSTDFAEKLTIHLYTTSWNEEYMLKYFFMHYDSLVDRYVFFDDGSTDQTLRILEERPKVEVRRFPRIDGVDSYILAAQRVFDNCWKESRGLADWVFTIDIDEFLYAPNMKAYLAECATRGVTVIPALGFQMISRAMPSSNHDLLGQVRRGCPWSRMNKLCVFDPNKIVEINQSVGRHDARPVGVIEYPELDILLNLHYKYLSFERTFNRNANLHKKFGSVDKQNKWGFQYGWTKEELQTSWDHFEEGSIEDVLSPDYNPHLQHSPLSERWWRKGDSSTDSARTG